MYYLVILRLTVDVSLWMKVRVRCLSYPGDISGCCVYRSVAEGGVKVRVRVSVRVRHFVRIRVSVRVRVRYFS